MKNEAHSKKYEDCTIKSIEFSTRGLEFKSQFNFYWLSDAELYVFICTTELMILISQSYYKDYAITFKVSRIYIK